MRGVSRRISIFTRPDPAWAEFVARHSIICSAVAAIPFSECEPAAMERMKNGKMRCEHAGTGDRE
jgi:hypothetical protein